jgi:hypothetical protein
MFISIKYLVFDGELFALIFHFHSFIHSHNLFKTFLLNEVKMKHKFLVKFLKLKGNIQSSNLPFLRKSIFLTYFTLISSQSLIQL